MSEQHAELDNLIKGLTDDQRAGLLQRLGGGESSLTESQLNKALDGVAARLTRPAVEASAEAEVDATGFLRSVDERVLEIDGNVRSVGVCVQQLGELVKGMRAENLALRGQMEQIAKGMSLPTPGRAVTATSFVPHPNGDQAGENGAAPSQLTKGGLIAALQDKFQQATDRQAKYEIAAEISNVTAGAQPNLSFAKSLGIAIS